MNEEEDRFARVRLVDGAKGDDALAAIPFSVRVERRLTTTKRRERKKRRESYRLFLLSGHRKKNRRYDKKEAKIGKTRNTFFLCILKSKTLRRKEEKPKGVPRGTVGTSDEGFGGLVGYDACLTRRRSSVRLRPEIQLFFCMCVRRQSERENIMQATFKLRAKSA